MPHRGGRYLMLGQTSQLADSIAVTPGTTVLVPVDFSSCSRAALSYAFEFTGLVKASIVILHVAHETAGETGSYRKNDAGNMLRPIDEVAENMLEKFIAGVKNELALTDQPVPVRMMVVEGLPASRIHEVAERENATCIIMGTHGRIGLSRLVLGSVAEKVVQHSHIPVTIIKDMPAERKKDGVAYTRNS